jgi:hypothetical protein
MGTKVAYWQGQVLKLTRRQFEILALLSLHKNGLSAEQLLLALYGEKIRSQSTLKAEVSHLRKMLNGAISSRPYRLTLPVEADFLQAWAHLQSGQYGKGLNQVKGEFFSVTDSPELINWRYCLDVVVSKALSQCEDVSAVVQFVANNPAHEEARYRLSVLTQI